MAWKLERWLTDVFPGEKAIYEDYTGLKYRELAIVAAGVLELALAEIISLRCVDLAKEYEEFLGLNGDGRAPAGSFGAKIQLGLLIGVLDPADAEVLRAVKNIRNTFAHRVNVSFCEGEALRHSTRLLDSFESLAIRITSTLSIPFRTEGYAQIRENLDKTPEAAEGLLLAVLAVYQAYFHLMHSRVVRIGANPTE